MDPTESRPLGKVRIDGGADRGTVFPLILRETLVGRIDSNHLVIDSPEVSRVHARFLIEADGVWIEDLNSRSGTRVNGAAVTRKKLEDGDKILLGDVPLTFSID